MGEFSHELGELLVGRPEIVRYMVGDPGPA